MSHDIWRSIFAALTLVTVSACAVATTEDGSIADESEVDLGSSSAASSEDDGSDLGSIAARPSTAPKPSQTEPTTSMPSDPNGPYPEPWSVKSK